MSPYFITDQKTQKCELENPYILIYDKKISDMNSLVRILELALNKDRELLVVAEDVESEALAMLILNKHHAGVKVCASKAPAFGKNRRANLADLPILTGGEVISEDCGLTLDQVKVEVFVTAKKVTVFVDDTIILHGVGDKKLMEERCEELKTAMEKSDAMFDREKSQERLSKLSGGVAVFKFGGASGAEVGGRKDRVTDALNATRATVKEGILPGAGHLMRHKLHSAASFHLESRRWFSMIPYQNDLLDIFDHLLQHCTKLHLLKQVHTQVIVNGSNNAVFLAARVISVYAGFGLLSDAQKVFETTPVHCLLSSLLWNSILRVNVSNGCHENALKLYVEMRKRGVSGDGFTFPLVIRACKITGCFSLGRMVHNHVLQMGFQDNVHVVNELIGMYAKKGQMDYSYKMFEQMRVRNHVSWNSMISGFALNYNCDSALEMFQRMEFEGLEPDLVTWTSLLSSHARCRRLEETIDLFDMMRMRGIGVGAEALAVVLSVCADLVAFEKGMVIHGCVKKCGFENYLFVKNALICMYGKHGDVKEAEKLFLEMKDKDIVSWNVLITSYAETGLCDEALAIFSQLENLENGSMERPNVISWSAVIGAFASKGRAEESLHLFRKMQHAKVMANSITISSVLSVCAELAALNIGREIHGYVVKAMMDSSILVVNSLLNMYMKCGCLEKGRTLFERTNKKDLISWNSIITGYGMNGLGEIAIAAFDQMIEAGFKPDGVTFVALLSACSHAGLVDEGRRLFDMMLKEFRIEPHMEHYACMVDLLCRAGLMQEASDIVKSMPIEPNACVWGALLNSCRMHKNTDVADALASHIFRENTDTTGNYMLLSNIYAASGRWEDSARVRVSAKTKGLKKEVGQSWIEVKNKAHMFTSGKSMQSDLNDFCGILEELALQMESEGYITDETIIAEDLNQFLLN